MTQKLTNLQVKEVSLVGKGAIGEKFTVMKSADAPPAEPVHKSENLLQRITKAVTDAISSAFAVKKSDTNFNDVIVSQELSENFYDGYWVLDDVLSNIMEDDTVTDKRSAISIALSQFSAYVLASFDDLGIQKSAEVANIVKKMAEIKKSRQTIKDNTVTDIQKGGFELKPEDLTAAITNAIAPIVKSVEDLGTRLTDVEKKKADPDQVAKTAEQAAKAATEGTVSADDVTKAVTAALTPLTKSVEELVTRVTTIEKMETPSASIQGQDGDVVKKSTSKWPSFAPR